LNFSTGHRRRTGPNRIGIPDRTRPTEEEAVFKLAVTITAALVLVSSAAAAPGAEGRRADRRIHQHQGIGGPPGTHHHHGPHRRDP